MALSSQSPFFLSQRIGRWRWPWLLLSVPVAVFVVIVALTGIFLGAEALAGLGYQWADEAVAHLNSDAMGTRPGLLALDLLVVGLPTWLAAMAASAVHGRSVRSLVAPLFNFRWSIVRNVLAFELVFLLTLGFLPALLGVVDDVAFTGFSMSHLVWVVPLLLLTLVQTSGEDVLVKGYLLRQMGAATGLFWLAPIVVVAIFVAAHLGNPDFSETLWLLLPLFVASELIIVYLMLRTGGMEVPLTLHWTNNSLIFLLVAERATQSNELTLFVWDNDPSTLTDDIIGTGLFGAIYLAAQLVAFTWRRSPVFLEPAEWPSPAPVEPPAPRPSDLAPLT